MTIKQALQKFLAMKKRQMIFEPPKLDRHLLRLIPSQSRNVPGLSLADASLAAPARHQEMLFKYRIGQFMIHCMCICDAEKLFTRGHEECVSDKQALSLTKAERAAKMKMQARLPDVGGKFTIVDFLLNTNQLDRAIKILVTAKAALHAKYHEEKVQELKMMEELEMMEEEERSSRIQSSWYDSHGFLRNSHQTNDQ